MNNALQSTNFCKTPRCWLPKNDNRQIAELVIRKKQVNKQTNETHKAAYMNLEG